MKLILLATALLASSAGFAEARLQRPGSGIVIVRPGYGSDVSLRNQAIRAAQQTRQELSQLANEVYDYGGGSFGVIERGGSRRPSSGAQSISELAESLADSLQYDVIEALRNGERLGDVSCSVDALMGDLGDLAEAIRCSSQADELSFRFGRVIQFFHQLKSLL